MIKKILPAVLLLVVAAGFCVYGQAADFTDETEIILTEQPAGGAAEDGEAPAAFFTTWDFIKVLLILAAVILIVYAVFYALKKAGGARFESDDMIRLIGSQSLTQNGSVHLIEVGTRYYLVGCSEGSVSHIADIDDKETIDEIMVKRPHEQEGRRSFSDFFNLKFGRGGDSESNIEKKLRNNNKFMRDQAERLKKM